MNIKTHAIQLSNPKSSERFVKRGALMAFRAVRSVAGQAGKVPGVLSQAAADVRDAWRETSCPNE